MTRRTGRHSAPVARKTLGASAFATSAIVGMTTSVAMASTGTEGVAHAEEAAAPVAQSVTLATFAATDNTVSLDLPEESTWENTSVSVSAQAPAPVVRETPQVAAVTYAQPETQQEPAEAPAPVQQATTVEEEAPAPAPVGGGTSAAVAIARQFNGAPYVYGASGPSAFDCSSFTQYVYGQLGISLPRSSSAQRYVGTVVPASQAQPGDLLWWPGHVGIYTGNGQHIAARNPSVGVKEGPIYGSPLYIRIGG